jgi:hypothetical protein
MIIKPEKYPKKGFYYHYKHDPAKGFYHYAYEVLAVGFDTEEDGKHCVVYRPLYEEAGVYQAFLEMATMCADVRPLSMFMGSVTKDGVTIPRFSEITNKAIVEKLIQKRIEMYEA